MEKSNIVTSTQQGSPRCVTQAFTIVGCFIEKDGKFLLIQQNGKWNQPAGWLELEEDLRRGAKREAEEETGIEVEIENLIGIYTLIKHKNEKTLHAVKFIFRARPTGKIIQQNEGLKYGWFSLEEIEKMNGQFWDPDVVTIARDAIDGKKIPLELVSKITMVETPSP